MPLGYLGDADKTARTFPVIDGVRYSVPGDRARLTADGIIELLRARLGDDQLGRREDLRRGGGAGHRPPPRRLRRRRAPAGPASAGARRWSRWCSCATGATATEDDLLAEAASHIARYKLPKAFVFVDAIVRSPAGKADYRWAKAQVDDGA